MASSALDLILRTKKEGNAEIEAKNGLGNLSTKFEDLTGVSLTFAAATGAVIGALKFCSGEAGEAEKATALLKTVVESTGGAAGLTVDELDSLATSLSDMSGVEDDTIIKAEAVMLTFTNLGKDVFPAAMTAALNMSAALGTDLQGSVTMLGKALEDPIDGLGALKRVGVNFSDSQVEMITNLQEAGDLMGAQTIILDELETKFGGAAAAIGDTFAGSLEKAKNAIGNLAEGIGSGVNTSLQPLIDAFTQNTNAAATFVGVSNDLRTAMDAGVISTGEYYTTQLNLTYGSMDAAEAAAWLKTRQDEYTTAAEASAGKEAILAQTYGDASDAALVLADDTETLKVAQDTLKDALGDLKFTVAGTVGEEYTRFEEKQITLKDRVDELRIQIEKLEATHPTSPEQLTELDDLRSKLGEAQQAVEDNAAAHDLATKNILFNLATQRAAMDGLTSDEMLFLGDLAASWGLIDESSKTALEAVDGALTDLAEGDSIESVVSQVQAIKDNLDAINGDFTANIGINVTGDHIPNIDYGDKKGGGGGLMPIENAFGGDYLVTSPTLFLAGEAGAERVNISPLGDRDAGGVVNNFYLSINASRNETDLVSDVKMLAMLYGRR